MKDISGNQVVWGLLAYALSFVRVGVPARIIRLQHARWSVRFLIPRAPPALFVMNGSPFPPFSALLDLRHKVFARKAAANPLPLTDPAVHKP